MKKTILMALLFISIQQSFAQQTFDGTTNNLVIFSGGVHQTFISNTAFNAWTATNYNTHINSTPGGEFDFTVIFSGFDIGGNYSWSNPYLYGGGFFGRRLNAPTANITTWLNFDMGGFYVNLHNSVPPVNYTPTPDQVGQKLQLHYNAAYIGLSSRNYFNKMVIRVGKRDRAVFTPSIHFSVAYEPLNGNTWKYGYYYTNPDDTSRHFKSVRIKSIPMLNRLYFNAGISLSVALKQ